MIRIVPAKPKHFVELARTMRAKDRAEILGMGVSVPEALRLTFAESLMTRAVLVDGELAAVWGVGGAALGGVGRPWLLTGPAFARIRFFAVRKALQQVRQWLQVFHRLENHVDASYGEACRFLEVLGFRLDEPVKLPSGMMARQFWMERP
jgi:hypothetical protein